MRSGGRWRHGSLNLRGVPRIISWCRRRVRYNLLGDEEAHVLRGPVDDVRSQRKYVLVGDFKLLLLRDDETTPGARLSPRLHGHHQRGFIRETDITDEDIGARENPPCHIGRARLARKVASTVEARPGVLMMALCFSHQKHRRSSWSSCTLRLQRPPTPTFALPKKQPWSTVSCLQAASQPPRTYRNPRRTNAFKLIVRAHGVLLHGNLGLKLTCKQ